jgi:hypothetical protein
VKATTSRAILPSRPLTLSPSVSAKRSSVRSLTAGAGRVKIGGGDAGNAGIVAVMFIVGI